MRVTHQHDGLDLGNESKRGSTGENGSRMDDGWYGVCTYLRGLKDKAGIAMELL